MFCSRSCVREQPRGYVRCWHRNNCITAFCRLNEMTCKDPSKSGHFCWVSYFTRILSLEILHLDVHYLMFHPGPDNLLIWLYQSEAAHYGYRHHKTQGHRKQNLDKKKKNGCCSNVKPVVGLSAKEAWPLPEAELWVPFCHLQLHFRLSSWSWLVVWLSTVSPCRSSKWPLTFFDMSVVGFCCRTGRSVLRNPTTIQVEIQLLF